MDYQDFVLEVTNEVGEWHKSYVEKCMHMSFNYKFIGITMSDERIVVKLVNEKWEYLGSHRLPTQEEFCLWYAKWVVGNEPLTYKISVLDILISEGYITPHKAIVTL